VKEPFRRLQNVRWEDPGCWPPTLIYAAAVVAFMLFSALGLYACVWRSAQPVLVDLQQQEAALRAELRSRYARVNSLALFRRQRAEIQRKFVAMQTQLPGATELPSLLVEISRAASDAVLEDRLFTPGNELRHELYAETPIRMRLTGTFHQLGQFLSGVAGLTRIVTLHDLQIIPAPNAAGGDALQLDVTARTYRYLDDDEIKAGAVAARAVDESSAPLGTPPGARP
jgi:type IV pilus assembly protein PilO